MQSGGGCFWRLPHLPPLQHRPVACQSSTNQRPCAGGLPGHSGAASKAHPQAESRPRGPPIEALGHQAPTADWPDAAARRASHAQASTSGSSGSTEQVPRLVKPARPGRVTGGDDADGQRAKRKVTTDCVIVYSAVAPQSPYLSIVYQSMRPRAQGASRWTVPTSMALPRAQLGFSGLWFRPYYCPQRKAPSVAHWIPLKVLSSATYVVRV